MVHLVDITPDNWRLKLQVSEAQKTYVAGSAWLVEVPFLDRYPVSMRVTTCGSAGLWHRSSAEKETVLRL